MRAASFAQAPAAMSDALTDREEQTLQLIAAGNSNKQIARELGISDGTVKIYVRSLLRKFHLHSRLQLASWVHRHKGVVSTVSKPAVGPASVAGPVSYKNLRLTTI